jgi:hypothetical protein
LTLATTTQFHVREDAAEPAVPGLPAAAQDAAPVIVVGAGPAGMKLARELRRQAPERPVLIFGDERWKPYNRVLLTPLFAGETSFASIYFPWAADTESPQIRLMHRRIVAIDPVARTVTDAAGESHGYAKLVLATGSRPHIPAPLALEHRHIFTFRDIDDAERLLAHWPRCRRALVVGGGLLGLEAARGPAPPRRRHHRRRACALADAAADRRRGRPAAGRAPDRHRPHRHNRGRRTRRDRRRRHRRRAPDRRP